MKRFSVAWTMLSIVLLTAALSAQGRGGVPLPPEPKNLQFFPKEMTAAQILPIMQNFNAALGVNCTYCHNSEPPADRPGNDFASDEKQTKKTARVMLAMARQVNMTLQSQLGKPAMDVTNVQCVTCHRGVAIPKPLTALLIETAQKDGINKAVQQYQDLRKQYYGAQAYDFTDASLFAAAQQSLMANKMPDALAFAQLNIAYNPTSARSYQIESQIYQRQNLKEAAIGSLQKAIQLDPMNQGYKNQLQQLQAGGGAQ
jgi:hypothetical protein